jgi:hypothetical protein
MTALAVRLLAAESAQPFNYFARILTSETSARQNHEGLKADHANDPLQNFGLHFNNVGFEFGLKSRHKARRGKNQRFGPRAIALYNLSLRASGRCKWANGAS